MPRLASSLSPVDRLAKAWSRCAGAKTRPLHAYYRLGRTFQLVVDALPHGQKNDLLLEALRVIRQQQPD